MNNVTLSLLIALLLAAVPVGLFYWLDRRFMRRMLTALARWAAALAVLAVAFYYVWMWNEAWLNILWVMLMLVVWAAVTGRKRHLVVPMVMGTLLPLWTVGLLILSLLPRPLADASAMIPVMALLTAEAVVVSRNGLKAYAYNRRTHIRQYEYLVGNGAKAFEALRPFVTKAFASAFSPTLPRLMAVGIMSLPALLCGLLLGGYSTTEAIALTALLVMGQQACAALSLGITIYIYERLKH